MFTLRIIGFFFFLFVIGHSAFAQKTDTLRPKPKAQAQKTVQNKKKVNHIHSDKIEVRPDLYDGNQLFTGGVKFEHDGSYLECDSAVFYQEGGYFLAFSNAKLYNDTLNLSAYTLEYNSTTKIAKAIKNAVLVDKQQSISADELEYNRLTQIAKAMKNARLVDKTQSLSADNMEYNRSTQIAKAIGNVVLVDQGKTLRANDMVYNRVTDVAQATGNVSYTDGAQRLTSNTMIYNKRSQVLEAIGNVVFTDSKQTLKTEKLVYNQATEIARYDTGAVITSNDGTKVVSQGGVYNAKTKSNTLTGNVNITNDKYIIDSERADYDAQADKVILSGTTYIRDKKSPYQRYIETKKGVYNNRSKEAFLETRSSVHYDGKTLTGDKMYYNQQRGFGKARGNVVLLDPAEERLIKGDYGEAYKNIDSAFVTGKRVIAAKNFKGDSLFLHADTLMVVRAKNKKGLIRAFRQARLYKSDVQAKCDSISFDEGNGELTLFRDPIFWFNGSQITGDTIRAFNRVKDNRLDSVHVFQNAFVISRVDSVREVGFHQMKAKYLNAYLEDKELRFIKGKINAQSLTFAEDTDKKTQQKRLIGINRSDCGIIESELRRREVELISCLIGANSVLYPPSKLAANDRFLNGFNWREKERLKSKEDLFLDFVVVEGDP